MDLILVEGMKFSSIEKIEVHRSTLKKPLLCVEDKKIKAIVYDKVSKEISGLKLPKFQFNDTSEISNFIIGKI